MAKLRFKTTKFTYTVLLPLKLFTQLQDHAEGEEELGTMIRRMLRLGMAAEREAQEVS